MEFGIDVPAVDTEPVASVLRILDLKPLGEDSFEARSLAQVRRVYGGQVIAQALLAASATVPDVNRLPHSLHCYFLRGGDPDAPFVLDVTRLRDGRSFSNRSVVARQNDREIFAMVSSFQGPEDGLNYASPAPVVPPPQDLPSALELFRTMDHPVGKFLGKTAAFDVRHVQQSLYTGPDPLRSQTQEVWMRIRSEIPDDAPQVVHRALLAYVVDQIMLEPALRAVGLSWTAPGLSLASLDHGMWFHHDVDVNEWLLFAGKVDSVGGGRAKATVVVYTDQGIPVASASQEGMMRAAKSPSAKKSRWSFEA